MRVKKRDGRIVSFDKERIISAIAKAGRATGEFDEEIAEWIGRKVVIEVGRLNKEEVSIEEIQDIVENVLMDNYKKTARAYILYREQRAQMRELSRAVDVSKVEKYLKTEDWRVNENANIGYSLQGLNAYLSGLMSSKYWLHRIYPRQSAEAHINGDLHIHNLSMLSAYCVGWDLGDLLKRGFGGVYGKIQSKPPKHLSSALGQIVNFLFTTQGEAAGAVALSSLDTYLAPFIRYDKLTRNELRQLLQEFLFNMNVPTRIGAQSPFSNITLDVTPHPTLKEVPVIVGGKELMGEKYANFQPEMDMFNEVFWELMLEGDGSNRPFSFPIPTINITKDFDWSNPHLKNMWETTAKYGSPYFANYVNSDLKPEDARSMCCHLRLNLEELRKKGGGLFGSGELTGSIGVITLNMPRIGYLSNTEEEFLGRLNYLLEISRDALEVKRKILEKFTEQGLYPYSKRYLSEVKQRFGNYWANHFSTIGIIGLNEALINFMHKDIGTEEGIKFALKIMRFMREKLIKYQEETGHLYNLEATPSEGTSFELAKFDKEKFPDIITEGEDVPYYTNSSQLPVNYTDDPFELTEKQEELQVLYTGGTVIHYFLGESLNSGEEAKVFVKKMFENYKVPYITITPTFSVCPKHGYIRGEWKYCPYCDRELVEKYKAVVGTVEVKDEFKIG